METTPIDAEDHKLGFENEKQICRCCLSTEKRMKSAVAMQQYFMELAGINVSVSDGVPQWVCYECCALLQKAVSFKYKIIRAHSMLYEYLLRCAPFPIEPSDPELARYQTPHLSATATLTFDSSKSKIGFHRVLQQEKSACKAEVWTGPLLPELDEVMKMEASGSDGEDDLPLEEFRSVSKEEDDHIEEKPEPPAKRKKKDKEPKSSKKKKISEAMGVTTPAQRKYSIRKPIEIDPEKIRIIELNPEEQIRQREMGRVKVTSRKKGNHSEDTMKKAIKLVKSGTSIRKASKEFNLCYTTVRRYVGLSRMNPNIRCTPNYEVNAVFTAQEEMALMNHIVHCSQIFYGVTSKDCRRIAFQMAKSNNKKIPPSWMAAEMAGIEWLRSFKKRHPHISLKKPEACSLARESAFNKHNVDFFKNLKAAMSRHSAFADGTRVYNLDETATNTVQRPGKVFARKGSNVSKVASGEQGNLVTTCCIVSATGQALPPAMIFPRKKFQPCMLTGAPAGTLGLASATGWMDAELFVEVMKHFIKHVSASENNPALLIMDNHESHLSIDALDLAKSSGVTVLTLNPHTTAKLQPLDVGLNGPFKTYYNAVVDSWLSRNPGQPLTIYDIAECVGPAYQKSTTPVNIVNWFKKCGIFPFDDCIFTDVDFLPSTVTDKPLIATINMIEGEDNAINTPRISVDSDITVFNDDQEKPATSPSLVLTESAQNIPNVSDTQLTENAHDSVEFQHNPSTSLD